MLTRTAVVILALAAGCRTTGFMQDERAIDVLMRDYDGAVPGASVIVLRDGEAAFEKSYGLADLEAGIPATPRTNYRLASVTKQFTAAAIMILAQRESLFYEDPISRYFPSLPPWAGRITVRHLLTHTSGVIDYEDLIPEAATTQVLDRDVLRLLESQGQTYFEPGTSYRYSNTGYAFLALIVEGASGKSFATFLRDEIFTPLGMNDTVAHQEGFSTVSHRAYGYTNTNGTWERTDQSVTSAVLGDGGIYSSVRDLTMWDHALRKGSLLESETWKLAFTPATATDDPNTRYGFGWRISDHRGHRTLWHSGETRGFRNVLIRFPDDRLTVVVLTNRNDPPPRSTALAIADLFLTSQ
jgi:CubicO group peptidase (beta-lactamase class C family)